MSLMEAVCIKYQGLLSGKNKKKYQFVVCGGVVKVKILGKYCKDQKQNSLHPQIAKLDCFILISGQIHNFRTGVSNKKIIY